MTERNTNSTVAAHTEYARTPVQCPKCGERVSIGKAGPAGTTDDPACASCRGAS